MFVLMKPKSWSIQLEEDAKDGEMRPVNTNRLDEQKNGTTPSKHNKIIKSRIETDFQSKWKSRTFNTILYQFPFSGFMKFFQREIRLRNKTLGVFRKVTLLFFYNFEISPVTFQLIDVNIDLKIFKKTTGVLMMKQWKQR